MSRYGPNADCHVVFRTPQEAERHTRRVHNAPDCGLGWTPYTILVTYRGVLAHTAFHSMKDFRRWMGGRFGVRLTGGFKALRYGILVAR